MLSQDGLVAENSIGEARLADAAVVERVGDAEVDTHLCFVFEREDGPTFLVRLEDVLSCLSLADAHGAVPGIGAEWWSDTIDMYQREAGRKEGAAGAGTPRPRERMSLSCEITKTVVYRRGGWVQRN